LYISILPYIEQMSIYSQYRMQCMWRVGWNWDLLNSPNAKIKSWRCPSDRYATEWAQMNYAFSLGPGHAWDWAPNVGMFQWRRETTLADVRDGTSNTIMLAEQLILSNDSSGRTYLQDNTRAVPWPPGMDQNTNFPAQTTDQIRALVDAWGQMGASGTYPVWYGSGCWSGYAATNHMDEKAPPNWRYPNVSGGSSTHTCDFRSGDSCLPARSAHPGGVNVALGDASVRFVSDTIDLHTWHCMGARNDGQVFTMP